MKTLLGLLLMSMAALAQEGPNTNPTAGPPMSSYSFVAGYTGTNIIYLCSARSVVTTGQRAAVSVAISAASNAAAVVLTSTGHSFYLNANNRPLVKISGGTGNWTAINGTFTATIIDANTFSIPVDSTSFGALTGTIKFTTTAPRLNQPEWAVELYAYDGSNNMIFASWLNGSSTLSSKCSDATSTTLNVQ